VFRLKAEHPRPPVTPPTLPPHVARNPPIRVIPYQLPTTSPHYVRTAHTTVHTPHTERTTHTHKHPAHTQRPHPNAPTPNHQITPPYQNGPDLKTPNLGGEGAFAGGTRPLPPVRLAHTRVRPRTRAFHRRRSTWNGPPRVRCRRGVERLFGLWGA
jgi:hypothetical protein